VARVTRLPRREDGEGGMFIRNACVRLKRGGRGGHGHDDGVRRERRELDANRSRLDGRGTAGGRKRDG
jgi:hypothetical protein